MTTEERARLYREKRDKEIARKLKESIAFLDKEEVKQALLNSIINKYLPKLDELTKPLEEIFNSRVDQLTSERIEALIKDNLKVFNKNLEEKVKEIVDKELNERFSSLIKYHDEY